MNAQTAVALSLLISLPIQNGAVAESPTGKRAGTLDALVTNDSVWEASLEHFGKAHEDLEFNWLSAAKEGFRSVSPLLSLNGFRVGETVVRGAEGKLTTITISLFNRGDNGIVSLADFRKYEKYWVDYITDLTGVEPEDRSDSKDAVANQTRLIWFKGKTAYQLETSVTRFPEFLRLSMTPKPTGAGYLGTAGTKVESIHRSDLRKNVVNDRNGDTYIGNVPMVDQGEKGYCAVATAERVFRYYGIAVDQHEMAQISKSSAAFGTSPSRMIDALGEVASKVKLRPQTIIEWDIDKFIREVEAYNREAKKLKLRTYDLRRFNEQMYYATVDPDVFRKIRTKGTPYRSFQSDIERSINQGIPLLWGVQLGVFPEAEIPQARGGHMRLIIGYNDRDETIIYSDSWGEGHAKKSIPMADAYSMTNGLYKISPTH